MSLDKEFQYFLDNQPELVKSYKGKYIVIKDEQVIGVYDTEFEAYNAASQEHALGTFLIQLCTPGNSSYSQTFHSRVIFDPTCKNKLP